MSIPCRFGSGKMDWDISTPIDVFRIMCHATTEQHEYSPSMGGSLVPVYLKEMYYVAAMGFVNILSWGISFCCMFQTNVTKPLFFGEMFTAKGLLASLLKAESPEVKHMELLSIWNTYERTRFWIWHWLLLKKCIQREFYLYIAYFPSQPIGLHLMILQYKMYTNIYFKKWSVIAQGEQQWVL